MPRKRRTPKETEEAALQASASASAAVPPVPRPIPQEPVLQAREDAPSVGGPPSSGAQQDFGPGPQQGGRSGGQGRGRDGGRGSYLGGSGRGGYEGGFPSSGQPPQAYPLSGPGEAPIEDVAGEEPGPSSPVRQTSPVSSRALRYPLRPGKSTGAPGGGSVRPLRPLKENIKKVMFYC